MQVFRKRIVSILCIVSFCCASGFLSQMSAESIEKGGNGKMPSVTIPEPPQMPDVTVPTVGSPFYKPDLPALKNQKQNENKTDGQQTSSETVLSSAMNTEDVLSSLFYGSNSLTAKDISSLSDIGAFSTMSALNGYDYYDGLQNSSTDKLLRQVLVSLDSLKKQQGNASEAENNDRKEVIQDGKKFKSRNPSVLRFKINGYDMSPSLVTVFFSRPEEDGSFLFTGDRKYYADRKNHSETFYILFKAEKSSTGVVCYRLTPEIIQDSKNENSFLYQMAQKKDITAEKTGNLVAVHYAKNNWKMDLLLDIDCIGD